MRLTNINDRVDYKLKCPLYYKKNTPRLTGSAEEYKSGNTSY
nr:MAG TPA: hypothetical protein [Caudoviricetes sp.]